ncbi:MAG: heparinase II/III family protein [Planctomycetes bacterium]|nr:heparinase II/III family protein [Planctomycetota bacterium]
MTSRLPLLALACCLLAQQAVGEAPPAPEPQLFVSDAELPALRARLRRAPFKARWEAYLAKLAQGQPGGTAKLDDLASVRWLAWTVIDQAFAYRVTGRAEHLDAAWAALEPALGWERWHRDWDWNKGAELPTAVLALASGVFYDACGARLDDGRRARFLERVERLALQPYLASIEVHKDWWVADPLSNWTGTVHGQCGVLALALRDALPSARRAAEHARAHLGPFLETATLADGGGHEGVMYSRAGLEPACVFLHAWTRSLGEKDDWAGLPGLARERLLGYWDVYLHGPDQTYANFNDMDAKTFSGLFGDDPRRRTFGGPNANLCALFEAFWPEGDPLLLWAADHGGGGDFSRGIAPWWFLWRREVKPSKARPALEPAVVFRGAGHAVLRTSHAWLALQGGWIPDSEIHKNFDLGSFVLVVDGQRFVHDPGYGKREATAHSVLTLEGPDGKPLEQRKGARGRYLALSSSPALRYAAVDLGAAYGPPLRRWVRHVLLLERGAAVIVDEVELERGARGPALRLQVPCEPTLAGEGRAGLELEGGQGRLGGSVFGGALEVAASHPSALVTRLDPAREEHLVLTVLAPGPALGAAAFERDGDAARLKCPGGILHLARDAAGWRPTRLGKTPIEVGDPAARSLKRATGRARR